MSSPAPRGAQPPVGDPDALRALAGRLLDTADGLAASAAVLTAVRADLADAVWQGEAARAFAPFLADLPPRFDRIASSYRAAGRALADYAPRLAQAQADAASAFGAAARALTRLGEVARAAGPAGGPEAEETAAQRGAERMARAESRAAEDRRTEVMAAWRRDAAACAEALLDAAELAEEAGTGPGTPARSVREEASGAGDGALSVVAGMAALVSGVCSLVAFALRPGAGSGSLADQVAAGQADGSLAGRADTPEGRSVAAALLASADDVAARGTTTVLPLTA